MNKSSSQQDGSFIERDRSAKAPARATRTRVGVDGHVLDGKYQGSRTWLVELLRRVPVILPDVDFYLYGREADSYPEIATMPNVKVRRPPRLPGLARILGYLNLVTMTDGLDAIITQYFSPLAFPSRQVVVVHDVLDQTAPHLFSRWRRWRNRLFVGLSVRWAATVITVSEFSKRQISETYKVSGNKIYLVRNGTSGRREHAILSGSRPFALFVGRLEPRKNLRLALEAMQLVENQEGILVVVGEDDFERPDTLALLGRCARNVVHLERIADEYLELLFASANILVFPSEAEGWGIPVVEALSHNTPVIASDAAAIPEAGGALIEYVDVKSASAAAIIAGAMDRAFVGEMHLDQVALDRHLDSLNWSVSARNLASVIQSFINTTTTANQHVGSMSRRAQSMGCLGGRRA